MTNNHAKETFRSGFLPMKYDLCYDMLIWYLLRSVCGLNRNAEGFEAERKKLFGTLTHMEHPRNSRTVEELTFFKTLEEILEF